jgi:hypothetical protein
MSDGLVSTHCLFKADFILNAKFKQNVLTFSLESTPKTVIGPSSAFFPPSLINWDGLKPIIYFFSYVGSRHDFEAANRPRAGSAGKTLAVLMCYCRFQCEVVSSTQKITH